MIKKLDFLDVAVFILLVLVVGGILTTVVGAFPSSKEQTAQHDKHKNELLAFRRAWMDDCLQHAPPFQCVVLWSQVKTEEFAQ